VYTHVIPPSVAADAEYDHDTGHLSGIRAWLFMCIAGLRPIILQVMAGEGVFAI
jgi:hypothetical protein